MLPIDLINHTFGRWIVLSRAENTSQGQARWLCRCQCGTERILKSVVLRRKLSTSCGCWKSESTTLRSTKHGHANFGKITPTYHSWAAMKARCSDPHHKDFKHYGGRGITVCDRWQTFSGFLADMGDKPPGCSIDRINFDGNYEPSNCRWATHREQAQNRRSNRLITFRDKTMPLIEWARLLSLSPKSLEERLQKWSLEIALTTPNLKSK